MHPVLQKTLGGLSKEYYFRQFIFGLIFPAIYLLVTQDDGLPDFWVIIALTISTVLYPYSRFVYESVVGFIMGDNVFVINAVLLLAAKFVTMFICWFLAIFIAPIGLAYLYYIHSRNEAQG